MELTLLTVLILAFILIAIGKIWSLRIVAEKTGVETLIGTLRSTLSIQLVTHVARHGLKDLEKYHHSNPINYLEAPPVNYLGEFDGEPEEPTEGAWYFDTRRNELVYHVRFTDALINESPLNPELLHFQVQMVFRDTDNNGKFDPFVDSPTALGLTPLDNYRWVADDALPITETPKETTNGNGTE